MGARARPGLVAAACGSRHWHGVMRDAQLGGAPVVRVDLPAGPGLRVAHLSHLDLSRRPRAPDPLPCPGALSQPPLHFFRNRSISSRAAASLIFVRVPVRLPYSHSMIAVSRCQVISFRSVSSIL